MELALKNTVSPLQEMIAYETLWGLPKMSLKQLATMFREQNMLPSELLQSEMDLLQIPKIRKEVVALLSTKRGFSVCVNGDFQYPKRLQEARYPIELFYYKGDLGLLDSRCVSVVGARSCTEEGERRARKISAMLVEAGFTIVSGLAVGIDTAALTSAISTKGGGVIGVIGTPIDEYYPKQNRLLQDSIAKQFLLISQVPFYRYKKEHFKAKRNYFPQRNETMSALSEATIIVEASERSGTLTQARACLNQGRELFILNSCFENPAITWPRKYEEKGAIRVKTSTDILDRLGDQPKKWD